MKKLLRILITAGPTRERLDSVRFISNFSTGNMGYELAKAALKKGYKVTLISGPTDLSPPKGANLIKIEGARQLDRAVKENFRRSDCLFMASAVCDWRPERAFAGKIKKGPKKFSIRLVQNPDILGSLGRHKDGRLLVGFALESKGLLKNAKRKLRQKNLDLIIASRVAKDKPPFGAGKIDVTIIDRYGSVKNIHNATKENIANESIRIAERLWEKGL